VTIPAQRHGEPERIAAIVTAYHPDHRVLAVIESAARSCNPVIVVDNTPDGSEMLSGELPTRVRVVRPRRNLGLAGALDLGNEQLSADIHAVLLMDQDSVIPEGMVGDLAAHLADPQVGAAAPAPWDVEHQSYIDPRTALRADVADRPAVITSGLLVRKSALDQAGGFRADFFVDSVDIDFCLRLRRAGSRIVQDKRVKLPHSLGNTRSHQFLFLKVRVTHHPSWRLYWVFRNQTVLVKENWRRDPVWCLGAVAILARWVLLTALYETPRRRRLRAAFSGFADGARGRTSTAYLPAGDVVSATFDKAA
jgi:rhamnosyltransferase